MYAALNNVKMMNDHLMNAHQSLFCLKPMPKTTSMKVIKVNRPATNQIFFLLAIPASSLGL